MRSELLYVSLVFCILSLFGGHLVAGSLVYVGTEATDLYLCHFDDSTGNLTLLWTNSTQQNPSFLALHPNGQYLYTVNEVEQFDNVNNSGGISSYKINRQTGGLTFINAVPSYGAAPAHISLDETGTWIGVANYDSGNYGVWKVNPDFSIAAKATTFVQDKGHGPEPNQDGPHAHEFVFGRDDTFVVVPDLGNDNWNQFFFDERTGALTPITPITAPAGSGPRHYAFHPHLPYAYGVSEIASTVTVFSAPEDLKILSVIQNISTLPSAIPSAAAELQFSHDGRFLYTSNRYTNQNGTIAIFSIDQMTGHVTNIGYAGTLGIYPRFFTLSPDEAFVLVANQLSNNIQVFERDFQTGRIGKHVSTLEGLTQASHILFFCSE